MLKNSLYRLAGLVLALFLLATTVMPTAVRAAGPWYVATTGNDSNSCLSPATACATINGAIGKASSGDMVYVAEGTYTGTDTEVALINKSVNLSGGWNLTFDIQNGTSTIDGQGERQGVIINGGVTSNIETFTIQNGFRGITNTGSTTLVNTILQNASGTGIVNFGNLTAAGTAIRNNSAGGISNSGVFVLNNSLVGNNTNFGGIANEGTMTLNNSIVNGNTSQGSGGGAGIINFGNLTLNNSTISGNQALNGGFGGGIQSNDGTVLINNSTITNNMADSGPGGIGINRLGINWEMIKIQNSIVAGNWRGADEMWDCYGSISSLGYNLIGNNSNCDLSVATGDLTNLDPLLGPLQDNGGPTFTHALLAGSPAIDAGNPAGCRDQNGALLTTDQRGIARPQGGRCDIGAFELEVVNPVITVSIDILPGSTSNPVNIRSTGTIPVAILSTATFNAPAMVDKTSLTFGRTGDETSLASCNTKSTQDVNFDGRPDLVCNFRIQQTAFRPGDSMGVLKGKTTGGIPLQGSDTVKIHSK